MATEWIIVLSNTSVNELICLEPSIECVRINIWWINTTVSSYMALSIWYYILVRRRRWSRRRVGREQGGCLGSASSTRQLNAPWAWWIFNWRLITSEVCWIIVAVMNGRGRAWQISAVTPSPWTVVWVSERSAACVRNRQTEWMEMHHVRLFVCGSVSPLVLIWSGKRIKRK